MKSRVEIEPSLKPNLPNLLASATIKLETEAGPITIRDCRILQNKNGIMWFSLLTFSVQHAARQFEYRQTSDFPASISQQISAEALRPYEEWKRNGV